MVFSSPTFLFVFLPLTLLVTTLSPVRLRNPVLLAMSVVFYLWGAGDQIDVIALVSATAWLAALAIGLPRLGAGARRAVFLLSLVAVLAPLLWFKYVPGLTAMAHEAGLPVSGSRFAHLLIPLGISFFTFHGISYLVDVRRGLIPAERGPIRFALYLFLFPHQIAGPIVRYAEIREEIHRPVRVSTDAAVFGMSRFAWGLFKKAFIADGVAPLANAAFATPSGHLDLLTAWTGALAYALQIYFDFSAYSDMAIGLAAMMGFHFPENFAGPYRSVSVTEFWRRWHMTLSRWFRDYVYIPFGGNRHGPGREYGGLLLTFFLTSLWHGASWTFLVWGGLHSGALLLERATGIRRSQRLLGLRRGLMVLFVLFSWIPFRAMSLHQTGEVWSAMVGGGRGLVPPPPAFLALCTPWAMTAVAVGCLTFVFPWRAKGTAYQRLTGFDVGSFVVAKPVAFALVVLAIPAAVAAVFWNDFSPFLYFRF